MENNKEEAFTLYPEEEHIYDRFAGEAMSTLITSSNATWTETLAQVIAKNAFIIAEAMIIERRKRRAASIPQYK